MTKPLTKLFVVTRAWRDGTAKVPVTKDDAKRAAAELKLAQDRMRP